eukprot:gene778-4066_t
MSKEAISIFVILAVSMLLQPGICRTYSEEDLRKAYNSGFADGMQSVLRNYGASFDDISDGKKETNAEKFMVQHEMKDVCRGLAPFDIEPGTDSSHCTLSEGHLFLGKFRILWPTIVYTTKLRKEDVVQLGVIKSDIEIHQQDQRSSDPHSKDAFRGWSSNEMLDWTETSVRQAEQVILSHLKHVIGIDNPGSITKNQINVMLQLWATVLEDGGFITPRLFSAPFGAHWSGVVHIDTSGSNTTLVLQAKNTNPAHTWMPMNHRIHVVPDTFVVFPSDLIHFTEPVSKKTSLLLFNVKLLNEIESETPGIFCSNCQDAVRV